jgi:glutamate synthase (NADPH/NADH)
MEESNRYWKKAPGADGLYDPVLEKEACGVGFVVQIDGIRSNKVRI